MFIGHYSAAFAAKAARPSIPLTHLFVAVQLVDFAWAALVLGGIEQVRIVPGFLAASELDLHHMPYTHSLLATVIWAVAGAAIYSLLKKPEAALKVAGVIAAAISSHWLLDLLVHAPDLALYPGGEKVGFGLWSSVAVSQTLELGLLLASMTLCWRVVGGNQKYWFGFAAVLVVIQLINLLPGAAPKSVPQLAISALVMFTALSLAAAWFERRAITTA